MAAAVRLNQPPLRVDSDALPPDEARRLAELVDAAAKSGQNASAAEARPDSMSYTIMVERDGETLTLKERNGALSPNFVALRDWIERHGQR